MAEQLYVSSQIHHCHYKSEITFENYVMRGVQFLLCTKKYHFSSIVNYMFDKTVTQLHLQLNNRISGL